MAPSAGDAAEFVSLMILKLHRSSLLTLPAGRAPGLRPAVVPRNRSRRPMKKPLAQEGVAALVPAPSSGVRLLISAAR
ncbi:hypothetical protein Sgou_50100 [Streptomyces gougerotii]|uniref:Uncharacterized protein n=2 Tax=Streptomyces diastaticus group TaxID=2849069 RepID=A0A8H9HD18_9ACTN|nr:hypothetical protein Sdia_18720 [Streptomyces diastaticus subsp. diastaticus]GFH80340.1 hypothetical protein Sgou_50100 [Streptomyces gougerotii]GGU31700.1 hypothetical protein GCM10015534_37910 [Streptomyces diastaticus subsp. diastaticus]GGU57676.1 hypothetical protein GCM10010227_08370 [Streptomyces gougerotii]